MVGIRHLYLSDRFVLSLVIVFLLAIFIDVRIRWKMIFSRFRIVFTITTFKNDKTDVLLKNGDHQFS